MFEGCIEEVGSHLLTDFFFQEIRELGEEMEFSKEVSRGRCPFLRTNSLDIIYFFWFKLIISFLGSLQEIEALLNLLQGQAFDDELLVLEAEFVEGIFQPVLVEVYLLNHVVSVDFHLRLDQGQSLLDFDQVVFQRVEVIKVFQVLYLVCLDFDRLVVLLHYV